MSVAASTAARVVAASLVALAAACGDTTAPAFVVSSISATAGNGQHAVVATALPTAVAVQVMSTAGVPVPDATVRFAVVGAGGSVSTSAASTDASGTAQVLWTLGTVAGIDSLTATTGSYSVTFTASATPDVPAQVLVVSGDAQSAPAGTALAAPLVVMVLDKWGNAVPSTAITWSTSAGGVLASATTTTDANGMATDALTLGATPGPEPVTVSVLVGTVTLVATFVEQGN
ncbi:MAG: Ig-like domain-containing protein [Gemmatimonadetes bacterium]|nr:Ig-like domain-containing protein [Gemmatimonadota bacterium]